MNYTLPIFAILFASLWGLCEYLESTGKADKYYKKVEQFFLRLERITLESILHRIKTFFNIFFNF